MPIKKTLPFPCHHLCFGYLSVSSFIVVQEGLNFISYEEKLLGTAP